MANKFKEKVEESSPPPKRVASVKPKAEKKKSTPFIDVDGAYFKAFGFFVFLLCLMFLVAFISFFFTWQSDASLAQNGILEAVRQPEKAENWLGKLGAGISHKLMHKGFGIGAFAIPYVLFWVAVSIIFKKMQINLFAKTAHAILLMIALSTTASFIFRSVLDTKYDFAGGAFGEWSTQSLNAAAGLLGLFFILLIFWVGYFIIRYNVALNLPEKRAGERKFFKSFFPATLFRPKVKDHTKKEAPFDIDEDDDEPKASISDIKGNKLKLDPNSPQVPPVLVKDPNYVPLVVDLEEDEIDDPEEAFKPIVAKVPRQNGQISLKVNEAPAEKIAEAGVVVSEQNLYDPKLDLSSYRYPELDLLEDHGSGKARTTLAELEQKKEQIINTLKNYNIEIDEIRATPGPTVTLYEIIPAKGVKISKIKSLEDDIALSLAALGIRIIAPIPGKGTIGIEVPNEKKEVVSIKSLLASEKFINSQFALPVALGKTISNDVYIADLAKMPHLLMAGATGQGKSVGLNAILVSLLYKKHPSQLKFVLIDPKKVELSIYKHIERHFLAKLPNEEDPIITDTQKVVNTLNSLCIEMDQRYDLLKDAEVRNILEYNEKFIRRKLNPEKGHKFLPYIVLVVDEFADLMMTAGKEVEMPIARLAQLARAIGIHLIIATQRPSVNIITGTIKANFPTRVAFRVSSKIDSRTILDTNGADQLIGRGDMLISDGNELIRMQCGFVDTPEVERITEYIGAQRGYPDAHLLPEFFSEGESGGFSDFDPSERDVMFVDAARIVVMTQQGSTSTIQRKLKLGYNRAGRIVDQLESAGIVGPFEGSKARKVLIPDEASLEQFLNHNLKK